MSNAPKIKDTSEVRDVIAPITSHYWNNLLTLLISSAEIPLSTVKRDVFCDVVIELKYVIDPTVNFTRKNIMNWLDNHQSQALEHPAEIFDDRVLSRLLESIKPYGHRVDILTSLVRISIADGVYGDFEQELTKKVILLWCLPETIATDIHYICSDLMTVS